MCGRYTLSTPSDLLSDLFELESTVELEPRFNIAPSQMAPVVRLDQVSGSRRMDLLQWGLVPFWAKDPSIGNRMINARSETVGEKPAYRNSLRKKRCLVVADGFYEWKATGGAKQPVFLHRQDGRPFAMAGLWDSWDKQEGAQPLETFTILTTEPNEIVAPIHRRMPVILQSQSYGTWLDPEIQSVEDLQPLMKPAQIPLQATDVSTYVNSPANEGPRCIEPID